MRWQRRALAGDRECQAWKLPELWEWSSLGGAGESIPAPGVLGALAAAVELDGVRTSGNAEHPPPGLLGNNPTCAV